MYKLTPEISQNENINHPPGEFSKWAAIRGGGHLSGPPSLVNGFFLYRGGNIVRNT